jgi:alpha-L-fucosidase 2
MEEINMRTRIIYLSAILVFIAFLLACASNKAVRPTIENLAIGKQSRQSSTAYGGEAKRAVDGNTSGDYYGANSVTHTNNQPQQWWEVDLGKSRNITSIKIWNRTDCCAERLSNFYVMVSEKPLTSNDLRYNLSQSGVWNSHYSGAAGRTTDISVNAKGRYVRIQLAGANYLALAEVEVFGY